MANRNCEHHWLYPSGVIDGRTPGETAIVRQCSECQVKQAAFILPATWEKATGDYALAGHYEIEAQQEM